MEAEISVKDVVDSLEKHHAISQTAVMEVVFSDNRETAYVRLISGHWQRMDLTEDWFPIDPVPSYIPGFKIESFYKWLGETREKAYRDGRRYGENQMRAAIRNLIGAADLVTFDPQDNY